MTEETDISITTFDLTIAATGNFVLVWYDPNYIDLRNADTVK